MQIWIRAIGNSRSEILKSPPALCKNSRKFPLPKIIHCVPKKFTPRTFMITVWNRNQFKYYLAEMYLTKFGTKLCATNVRFIRSASLLQVSKWDSIFFQFNNEVLNFSVVSYTHASPSGCQRDRSGSRCWLGWHCLSLSTPKPCIVKLYISSLDTLRGNFVPCNLVRQFHVSVSSIFMSCYLVRHFHVLQFHALQLGPSISCPAISCPSFSAPPLISTIQITDTH